MSRTQAELQAIGAGVAKMFACYPSMFVSEGATDALMDYLDEFTAEVIVQALRLTPMFVPNRYPNAPEVREVASHIRRSGYAACRYAASTWRDNSTGERTALVGFALKQGIKMALDRVGNPDQPKPAGFIAQDATPAQAPMSEHTRNFKAQVQARAREYMEAGLSQELAMCRAIGEQAGATRITSSSVPGRKRRASA